MSDGSDERQATNDQQPVAREVDAVSERRPSPQESLPEIVSRQAVKDQVKRLTAAFAVVGAGIGLAVVLLGVLGKPPLLPEGFATRAADDAVIAEAFRTSFVNLVAALAVYTSPIVAAVTALGCGLYTGLTLDGSDKAAWVTAGIGTFTGTIALVVLTVVLASSQMEVADGTIGMQNTWFGTTVQFTPLVVDAIAVAVAATFVGAATAFLVRSG